MHLAFFILFWCFGTSSSTYHWPSPQIDYLEALLYETRGNQNFSLAELVDGCKSQEDSLHGSEAPDWLRMAFHDMATHNADDGTGGIDSSIFYELGLPENAGGGMVNTMRVFLDFGTKYISHSDIIAMGVVFSVAACQGPLIPFRGGRIDTFQAGSPGVPKPQDSIESITEAFRRQGFTPSEMISFVACGHSIGGVRNDDFPGLNTDNGHMVNPFDTTDEKFDNLDVVQYLDGTTKNPLVIDPNTTMTSDLKIFSSDGNVIMNSLKNPNTFTKTCTELFERMINTVPSHVTLTDVIDPIPIKVGDVQLRVGDTALIIQATLRLWNPPKTSSRKITMFWSERTTTKCSRATCSSEYTSADGITSMMLTRLGVSPMKYSFLAAVNATTSISKFWFEIDEGNGTPPMVADNGGTGYTIDQDRVLFDHARSSHYDSDNLGLKGYRIVAAVHNSIAGARVYINTYDSTDLTVKTATIDLQRDSNISSSVGYIFYAAEVSTQRVISFDLYAELNGEVYMEEFRQTLYIKI